ncbi:Ltp family lipoprotein [uncultured Intestinimonas sp.]|uniref:Ltp family lipoprotein n=1 Tax=uncultured Intestinimonas sp. TaxID=1689265 RepID=UPI0025FA6B42|nr:Ltp family lipoprotein [uncultured Intestinimonas sp.]
MKRRIFPISALVIVLALLGSCSSQPSDESAVSTSSPVLAEETQVISPADDATLGEKNALATANTYLSFSAFSAQGLIDQLEFEGYTTQEAQYAVAKCGADWNEQALKKAGSYLDYSAFSYSGLFDQLSYEGFLPEQAQYAVDNCGADWNEQAAKKAQTYLDFSSFSREGLINQLLYEGFTQEQAEYGVTAVGY